MAEDESVDPIWSTWKLGHDLAFGAAAMMAEHMAEQLEAEHMAERGDPVRILRNFANLLRLGKYNPEDRQKAMVPIDAAIEHMLDDPRVLGELSARLISFSSQPNELATYILACLKEIIIPKADDEPEAERSDD